MKLRDGREFPTDQFIDFPNVQYNVYDCPGEEGAGPHIEHGADGLRMVPGVVSPLAHQLLSMDVDEGVTPFMVTCPDHGVHATSRFYRMRLDAALLPVRMVWRKATKGELKRERRDGGDHYSRGGLAREWASLDEHLGGKE